MNIDRFGWTIREPVRARPFAGAACGVLSGTMFGLIAGASVGPTDQLSIIMGYVLGGLLAGGVIGSCLPLFRYRLAAGVIVALAATAAGFIVNRASGGSLPSEGTMLVGCSMGFAYAVLFWKYSPD